MKLLFVLDNYWPHVGGVETAFKHLCEGLAERGHDVTVVVHRAAGTLAYERLGGVEIIRLACRHNRYIYTLVALVWVAWRRPKADVIQTTTFNGAAAARLAGLLRMIPVVMTVNETWIGRWNVYSNFPAWKATVHEFLERAVFAIPYDRYVGISAATSARLRAVINRAKNRTETIYYGFDPGPWSQTSAAACLMPRLAVANAFVVLAYGRPGTSKGFEWLIDAIPSVVARVPSARFILILSADHQYRRELARLKARADKNVTFLPSLPFQELVAHVRAADCVVVPSLAEGFGYTTLEAVASGVPVIASNVGSIPEVIGGQCQLIEPRDKEGLAQAIVAVHEGRVPKRPVPVFTWESTVTHYETLYVRLCDRR